MSIASLFAAFDPTLPASNTIIASYPQIMREQLRSLKDDGIVNAATLASRAVDAFAASDASNIDPAVWNAILGNVAGMDVDGSNAATEAFRINLDLSSVGEILASLSLKLDNDTFAAAIATISQEIIDITATDTLHDSQISALTATDTLHSNQISDLMATDTLHDNQVSGLIATDSLHDSQISALTATDTLHSNQISALVATDTIHSDQVAALTATDTAHSDQIAAIGGISRTGNNSWSGINTFSTDTVQLGMFLEKGVTAVRSSKDANDIFTTIVWKDAVGTIRKKSVLSGGTTPEYASRTEVIYGPDGIATLSEIVFTQSYDGDGDWTGESYVP